MSTLRCSSHVQFACPFRTGAAILPGMAKAAILLAILALAALVGNVVVGTLVGLGHASVLRHFQIAIPTTIIALGAWTVVIFYFIGARAWVHELVAEGGAQLRHDEDARQILRWAIPWVLAAAVTVIAAYVVGGGVHSGAVHWGVHLALAVLAVLVHLVAVYRTIVLVGMMLDVQAGTGP